jgi:bifunctional ADP-heptose synthase (sugar kinase/adenylyltransferase)
MLSQLMFVDAICIFDDDTPIELLKKIRPDILTKGGDYTLDGVVGRDMVEKWGGKVLTVALIEGRSTTSIIDKIVQSVKMDHE